MPRQGTIDITSLIHNSKSGLLQAPHHHLTSQATTSPTRSANMYWDRQSRISSFFNSPERGSPRSSSYITRSSSPSSTGSHSDLAATLENGKFGRTRVVLGICAMDIKARSKAMREIITRLVERARGAIEVKVFGDKVILDEGMRISS
jgi:hypothetical protein